MIHLGEFVDRRDGFDECGSRTQEERLSSGY